MLLKTEMRRSERAKMTLDEQWPGGRKRSLPIFTDGLLADSC